MKKVLVIEDSRDLLTLYVRYLNEIGCEVTSATSAHEALHILEDSTPDLILMDLTFPDMPTMDFYMQISANPKWEAIKKILVSGRDDLHTWMDVFNTSQGLRKPVQKRDIVQAVNKELNQ
ncbi:response regulator [Bdellovibrio sp. SKB1291214]|uniref:response regulator n=1 Tax=Bdellovibrio sp. SKB1291214 TaxID=1732569 RepID=UPI000B515F1A|nr:response regulator [Bdellovibrio sp. SKB1291214]UYL09414.1 response regulator [Bdellovibrio sp. SKB1291214]